ncbi:MAG: dihydropteroate synthase [Acidobacteriota bacterium]
MGILNVTPDSFFDGGRYFSPQKAVRRGLQMVEEGADILDVGGESTRPMRSNAPSAEEEWRRIGPVIRGLKKSVAVPISVDTYRASVARQAIDEGAEIVNDIGGLRLDPGMTRLVAESRVGVVLMHSRGAASSLHSQLPLKFPVNAVVSALSRAVRRAVKSGIRQRQIIVDPGLGFGKRGAENLALLRELERLAGLDCPVLIGASRKSFLGTLLNQSLDGRLAGSLAAAAAAIFRGAHILRVHDVKESWQVARVCDALIE